MASLYLEETKNRRERSPCCKTMRKMKGKTGLESSPTSRRVYAFCRNRILLSHVRNDSCWYKVTKIIDFAILAETGAEKSIQNTLLSPLHRETILEILLYVQTQPIQRYRRLQRRLCLCAINQQACAHFDEYVDKEFGTGALEITPCPWYQWITIWT